MPTPESPRRSGSTYRARAPARGERVAAEGATPPRSGLQADGVGDHTLGRRPLTRRGVPALRLTIAARRSGRRRVSSRETQLAPASAPRADGGHATAAE